jgi:hypothetical protein
LQVALEVALLALLAIQISVLDSKLGFCIADQEFESLLSEVESTLLRDEMSDDMDQDM